MQRLSYATACRRDIRGERRRRISRKRFISTILYSRCTSSKAPRTIQHGAYPSVFKSSYALLMHVCIH